MTRTTVLHVCHGHPDLRPGGAEVYAWELFHAAKADPALRPYFLARADADDRVPGTPVEGPLHVHRDHPDCYFVTDPIANYELFAHELLDATVYHRWLGPLVRRLRPDVVHFQHTIFLGYELVRRVKEWLPGVRVVYTLHDYHPICAHAGQMAKTRTREPCPAASPAACHDCFPDLSPMSFLLRRRHIQAELGHVDLFVAPSRFLRDKFIEWGMPADRIRYEDYGRNRIAPLPDEPTDRPRNRFAFFGQLNLFKGADVLLRAAKLLAADPLPPRVVVHGGNLDIQPPNFQESFRKLLADVGGAVEFPGGYTHADLPAKMRDADWVVVPSVWWENSPLVIQEAFMLGRPVICSGIGGMAEKVTDGVSGLHFRVGDAASLAAVMRTAAATPGLWDRLRAGLPPVRDMTAHAATLAGWYRELMVGRQSPPMAMGGL